MEGLMLVFLLSLACHLPAPWLLLESGLGCWVNSSYELGCFLVSRESNHEEQVIALGPETALREPCSRSQEVGTWLFSSPKEHKRIPTQLLGSIVIGSGISARTLPCLQ